MKILSSPRLIRLFCLSPVIAVPVASAQAQDLHPDWSRVWSHDAQPLAPGSLLVPADGVVPVTLDRPLSSLSARVGDIVTATPISRVPGDSEFPPGTRFGGVVSQTQPASGTTPGVLDVDFQSALLPDGTEVPIHGFIASLDLDSVRDQNGHLIARDGGHVNAWKAIGVGGGVGFVLGRLLKTDTLVPTILGAAGAYLYARSNTHRGEDATIAANTTLGIRLETEVSFPDTTGYASLRLNYLQTHRTFAPELYGWNQQVCAPPRSYYSNYSVVISRPVWISVDPFDYYGYPLTPVWSHQPHGYYNNRNSNSRDTSRDLNWNRGWGNTSRPISGIYGPQRPVDGIFGHERVTPDGHIGSTRPGSVFSGNSFPSSPSRLDPSLHRGSQPNGSPIELPSLNSKQGNSSSPRSGFNFGDVFGSRSKTSVFHEGNSSASSSSGPRSNGDVFNWGGGSNSASRERGQFGSVFGSSRREARGGISDSSSGRKGRH